jgi:hypothetical protein
MSSDSRLRSSLTGVGSIALPGVSVRGTSDKVEGLQEIVSKPKIMIVNSIVNGAASLTFICNLLRNAGKRVPSVTNNLLGDESIYLNSDL